MMDYDGQQDIAIRLRLPPGVLGIASTMRATQPIVWAYHIAYYRAVANPHERYSGSWRRRLLVRLWADHHKVPYADAVWQLFATITETSK